ncbi:MAG TPA: BTAD domain-containing putative transcriptional regulator [Anaerolineae bacterium]|nr:BTAD domain-containing putative transcriptional regulator [Anaerolineae bacterium]
MNEHSPEELVKLCRDLTAWPIMICLLGNFRLLQAGQPLSVRVGSKIEALLAYLALHHWRRVPREQLVQELWPDSDLTLGLNSLNNLVHQLNKLLASALEGAPAVLNQEGYYRLNEAAGIGIDVKCFDVLVDSGNQQLQAGDPAAALAFYRGAIKLYRNDLFASADAQSVIERERLRSRYLRLLVHLAETYFQDKDYSSCLEYVWQLLAHDPYREDAHRLVMRCYVRRNERAAALRHYQVCVEMLREQLQVSPESATVALFEQIRLNPDSI